MSRVLLILMVTLGAGAAAWGQGVTKLPKVIYLTAVDGKKVAVKTQAAEKATVLAWTNLGCPMCKIYRPRLESMAAEYAAKGIRFVLIDSSQQDHAAALKVANEELSGDLRILRDLAAKVARKLKVTRTTEILVAGRDGKVVYRGALDDQYGYRKREAGGVGSYRKYAPEQNYLREALDAILAGKKPEVSSTAALGCALNLNWKET
ncbi:MAG: redoxin family protein, partial [Planctomycetota bacterium]